MEDNYVSQVCDDHEFNLCVCHEEHLLR